MPRLSTWMSGRGVALAGLLVVLLAGQPAYAAKADKEAQAAQQRHGQVLAQYGRYDDERLQQYVNDVGQRVAAKSDRPDLQYTFTVLDVDQINAFAMPGGYIYIFRGLMKYLNTEAELAAVLGHEIGHVTANHLAHKQAGATAANVGTTLLGVLTGHPELMGVAGMAGDVLISSYSREQELEADELGEKFISRAGYPPGAAAESLAAIWNVENFELRRAREEHLPMVGHGGLFASHPDTDKRIDKARARQGGAAAADYRSDAPDEYLPHINGLVLGSSPAQGVVRGSRFYHAGMGVTLAFPSGWAVDNQRTKVVGYGPNKDTFIEVSATGVPPNMPPKELLGRMLRGQPVTGGEPLQANGLDGYRVVVRSTGLPWGNQGPATVATVYYNGLAYLFVGSTRLTAAFTAFEPVFVSSVKTFRRLRDNEFTAANPDRLRVIEVPPGATIEQLARNSPTQKYAAEELRLLNDLYPDKEPVPGQRLKIVQ